MSVMWVTRSEPGASQLGNYLVSCGINVLVEPCLTIRATHQAQPTNSSDLEIFLSRHAVEHSFATGWRPTNSLAIGSATASCIEKWGLKPSVAAHASSESVFEWIQRCDRRIQRVLMVCGRNSRPYLSTNLKQAGIEVIKWEVYERRVREVDVSQINNAIDVIECSSVTTLRYLYELTKTNSAKNLMEVPIIVPSKRVLQLARSLGFREVHCCANASKEAIFESFENIQK